MLDVHVTVSGYPTVIFVLMLVAAACLCRKDLRDSVRRWLRQKK